MIKPNDKVLFGWLDGPYKGKYYPYGGPCSIQQDKFSDYGTGMSYHEAEAPARVLLPEIQAFFESEEGQREYAEWKAQQQAEQENRA